LTRPGPADSSSLWPREHGAYGELAFPIVSALVLGRPTLAAIALGLAAILVFLAHEPMLVLVGRRGARRKTESARPARVRLALLGGLAVVLGGAGLAVAPRLATILALVPVAIGLVALGLAATGRERSLGGELHVALSLSSIALPVAIAAGLDLERAVSLVSVWAIGFGVSTGAARGLVFRGRDGGRLLRITSIAAAAIVVAAIGLAAARVLLPGVALAPIPFAVLALGLRIRPPSPKQMSAVGYSLVGASVVTLALLAFAS